MGLDYQEIEKIINNETNAGGFAELIKNFKEIGVSHYEYRVAAGMYRYYDEDSSIDIQFNGIPKPVVPIESAEKSSRLSSVHKLVKSLLNSLLN